jgi:GNAT superfamily N-acetyltransferase
VSEPCGRSCDNNRSSSARARASKARISPSLLPNRNSSVFCVDGHDDGTAVLRLLLVHPDARGRGVGGALTDTCLAFARAAGYRRMRLWTNDPLVEARQVYLRRGFRLTAQEPHHSFGADLVGQTYAREL